MENIIKYPFEDLKCPFEDCSAEMTIIGFGVEEVECWKCVRMLCAQCKVGWHEGMECQQFQNLPNEDVMMMNLAHTNNWKRCPNCKIFVDKIDGCLHITCMCGSEFCYRCETKWRIDHACA